MVEEVKYIKFGEVPEAPQIAVPADFTQDQIKEYLKSDYVEQQFAEKGFAFKYGLDPVNQLELDNLDDWHLTSGLKKGWLSTKAIGQGALAWFNDAIGNEEGQQEALNAARQYQLDKAALAYQVDDNGQLLPRIEKIEDIVNSEEHLTGFTKYVREKFGEAAATSFPTLLLGALGAGIGSIVPGAGTALGATAGTLLSGFIFGLGETYLAQSEETDDPNLALSVALGIPYAAAERLGIGGVVPSLIKTFGSKEAALKAMQKSGIYSPLIKGGVINKKVLAGKFATEVGRTGIEEGLAEAIQETLTTFGGGLEAGEGFDEMFNNVEFAKQLGEAAAAGFFGGLPFGTINPSMKALKVLNRMGGVNNKLDGTTLTGTLNDDPDQDPISSAPFTIGTLVTVENKFDPDISNKETPLFGTKPKFRVIGTTEIEGDLKFVLQSEDIKPAVEFLSVQDVDKINVIEEPTSGGEVPEQKENFAYDGQATTNKLDDATRKQHTDLKRRMVQTGHLNSAQETEVTTFLKGDDTIVRNVANRIIADREQQRQERQTYEATPQEDRESDLLDFIPKLDRTFAKYDAVPDNELEEAIRGDLPFWRTREFAEQAEGMSQEVSITPDQDKQLKDLGYFGERGQRYVDERIRSNVNPVNKTTSSGKALLDSILRNGTRFSTIPDIIGGPVKVQQKIGEKISRNEPLTAQEKASLSGDRLIPATKYDPSTYTEGMSFEDLYDKPVEVRMRIVLELASKLDKDGWKRKQINDPQLKELEQALKDKIKVAEFQYGRLSESYKQAKKDLADFRNTGEHVLINGLAPKGVFSLVPILSPTAEKTYNNVIRELKRNLQSEDPIVRKTAAEQLPAYENMVEQVIESRTQMNELLKSMSLDPIINWNEFTERSMKSKINKYRKKLNQTDTEFKKKDIYSQYTMLNKEPDDVPTDDYPEIQTKVYANLIQIMEVLRQEANKLGLATVDIGMMSQAASGMLKGPGTIGAFLPEKGMSAAAYRGAKAAIDEGLITGSDQLDPSISLSMMHIAFDLDRFNNATPEEKFTMAVKAFSTLHHEAIHALKSMGLFTKQEWQVLTKASEEFFIIDYQIKDRYPRSSYSTYSDQQYNDLIIEEGIASAMQSFLVEGKGLPKSFTKQYTTDRTILQKLFDRIKAFLTLLGFSFKQNGFNNAYDIFDAVAAGTIGQRVEARSDIQKIKIEADIEKTMGINPMGVLVSSNRLASDDPATLEFQKGVIANFLSDNRFRTLAEAEAYLAEVKENPAAFKNLDVVDKLEIQQLKRTINRIRALKKPLQARVELETRLENAVETKPNKPEFRTGRAGIGGIDITAPYTSMYMPLTADQFLDLVPPLDVETDYTERTTSFMMQQALDGVSFGVPYIEIEINETGGIGRVVSHEGRHRVTTIKALNNGTTKIPVAVRFKRTGDPEAYKKNRTGRSDVRNKTFLANYLAEGLLVTQGGTTESGAISNMMGKKVYESFLNMPDLQGNISNYNFSKPYNNDFADNPAIRYEMGAVQDPANRMNRQQKRTATKKLKEAIKDGEQAYVPGSSQTPRKMSYFSRILGHARAWAKMDTPFRLMYANVMNKIFKSRSLQMSLTAKLKERYLEVKKDPVVNERINKAHIIMEMTGQFPEFNENGELVFVAPADGGAADLDVVAGEVVILTGDVAMAMKDHQLVMASIIKEDLKATIARDHIEDLTEALNVIRTFFPNLPELQDQFNFEGMTEEQISYALENLNVQQIKFIVDNLSNVMIGRGMVTGEFAEIINRLLGNQDAGLNKLLTEANVAEGYMRKPYVPLQRFGDAFISVKDDEGRTIWYETFEGTTKGSALRKAKAKRSELVRKYPNATVSQPEIMTIQEIRRLIKEAGPTVSIEYLSQFMSDTNARRFQEAMKEMRQVLAAKGLDKDISPIGSYRTPRDRSVGLEGVPGYSADFTRGTLQYIMTASEAIARNRYQPAIRHHYGETIEYAQNTKDVNLQEATQAFFDYTEDPVQEFANLRRMGFWWYLGGNISSAMLQTMSLFQFTGPLLSQMAGTKATTIELGKAIADARTMVSIFNRQYEDAFIDFNKVFDDEPGMAEAIYTAVADGTIKQGQAMQEAGIVPGPGGSQVGSQSAAQKNFRKFENIFVGGTFNTFEAISRITAFMTAYRLASKNPKVLEEAEVLYGNDMDYQNQKDRYGNTPEAFARFMVEETFGVYGKENRPRLARGFGALPALFMTYISQMFGLLYRLLNPVGMAANKSKLQNKVGRRAFARIMLMMLITGGLFGLPGGEDAEDIYNLVRKEITGVDADVRSEFRNMLYTAGWSPTMIEALESGLLSAYLNIDVQRRIGFGVAPWSTQIRAAASIAGVDTGARAEEFLGAPGSVFIDALNNLATLGIREGRWGDAVVQSLPLGVKNPLKSLDYMIGEGYLTTSYGSVVTDDIGAVDVLSQFLGFTPTEIAKNREALFLMRKMDRASNVFKQRINARIENAYIKIIMGGKNRNGSLINEGQAEIQAIYKEVMKHNQNNPNQMFIPDLNRKFDDALRAADPNYAIMKGKQETVAQKLRLREALGLN